MQRLWIDGHDFCNMVINASNKLEEKKEYVNSLNVFPVPDGDTGTNMSMTFKTAVLEVEDLKNDTIGEVSKKLARGALMGARGNSGVIFSQIFRGISKALEDKEKANAKDFAECLSEGARFAYKAVMRPTEGTILTIIRAAAERANKSDKEDIIELLDEVCKFSYDVLQKTPEMLPELKEAKVVDAGGQGLLIILEGMKEALKKNEEFEIIKNISEIPKEKKGAVSTINKEIKYGYCTEFFVIANNPDVDGFKKELEPHGDSMVVVGMDDMIKVHIHTNDPGFILSKALKVGELSKIKIDNMREQHRHIITEETTEVSANLEENEHKEFAFIAVAMGKGITNIFKDLGVDFVIEGGQTMNPSTQDILKAVEKINAEHIFILPNNKNIIMAANQAAEICEKDIKVIPTKSIPQGITAITSFNFESSLEENVKNMEESIEYVTTGKITFAVRDTENDGKQIKEGNILGLVEDNIKVVGEEVYKVCKEVIDDILTEDKELLTVLYGENCNSEEVEELLSQLEDEYPDIDIQSYNGEQPLYYFILSAE